MMFELVAINGNPDASNKRCSDCFYCRGAVNLWCTNEEAAKYRGTRIPGVRNCHFWKPCRKVSEFGWLEYVGYLLFGWLTVIKVDCSRSAESTK